ncbi:MAG: helix-turn-helix transcriptional regulator [Mucilaginibacter sp.]|nr:helix-turn-helix transcriptional regulator [Mucilaginibacter sp.]
MIINLTNILFILIIFQLLFISFYLFTHQTEKKISNRLLGFFFLLIGLNLLDVFFLVTGVYFSYHNIAGFGSCLPLLFGPLLYFYTQSIVYKNFSLTVKGLKHFAVFVIFFSGTEFYYLFQTPDEQKSILRSVLEHHFPVAVSFASALIFIQFLLYAICSLRLVFFYKSTTNQLFSNSRHTNVSWLYSTIIFFTFIMFITTLNGLLTLTSFIKYYLFAFNVVILAVFIFVIQILMKALKQPDFFSFNEHQNSTISVFPSTKSVLYENGKSEKEKIVKIVLQYMQSSKPYLEPELTLDQLASQLSIKPRVLSQAINEILQQNFFDFINRYRIEEATRLLTNPTDPKITILEVLYEVGFNSKSSFNTLFKKHTGLTPTEFRKKQP